MDVFHPLLVFLPVTCLRGKRRENKRMGMLSTHHGEEVKLFELVLLVLDGREGVGHEGMLREGFCAVLGDPGCDLRKRKQGSLYTVRKPLMNCSQCIVHPKHAESGVSGIRLETTTMT